jgi:hypothetical protein
MIYFARRFRFRCALWQRRRCRKESQGSGGGRERGGEGHQPSESPPSWLPRRGEGGGGRGQGGRGDRLGLRRPGPAHPAARAPSAAAPLSIHPGMYHYISINPTMHGLIHPAKSQYIR